jgi:phospholipid/cholesterol/gamma-HCH transport system permease protein
VCEGDVVRADRRPSGGLTISGGGAKAVGNAVNETVVYAFMALFVINVVVTAIGIRMTTK